MEHYFTPLSPKDVVDALSEFEDYDVIQLFKAQHPVHTHVMTTNTWCRKWTKWDVDAWTIDEKTAERMLTVAKNGLTYAVDGSVLFPDDLLFEVAYEEFHSRVEHGTLYGVSRFEELVPYYNPIQPIVRQFPEDSEFEYTDTSSRSIREELAAYKKKKEATAIIRKSNKKPKCLPSKTLVKWDE